MGINHGAHALQLCYPKPVIYANLRIILTRKIDLKAFIVNLWKEVHNRPYLDNTVLDEVSTALSPYEPMSHDRNQPIHCAHHKNRRNG